MNLVRLALRRPLTILVGVIAVALGAWIALQRMTRDVFPPLGIPTIYVAQPFGGMDPAQMEGYLTYYYEYHFLYITGIEHVESKSIQGASIMKLQFHPGTDMSQAMSETVAATSAANDASCGYAMSVGTRKAHCSARSNGDPRRSVAATSGTPRRSSENSRDPATARVAEVMTTER